MESGGFRPFSGGFETRGVGGGCLNVSKTGKTVAKHRVEPGVKVIGSEVEKSVKTGYSGVGTRKHHFSTHSGKTPTLSARKRHLLTPLRPGKTAVSLGD